MESISAVLVTYNPEIDVLISSIKSILPQVDNLIIVDNNSSNAELVKNIESEKLITIFLDSNVGLATAQNLGIRHAKKLGSDFSLLFDQDSVIGSNFVEKIYSDYVYLENKNVEVAAVGPFFYDRNTKYIYNPTNYVGPFISKVEFDNEPVSVTFVIASGSLIRMKVLEKIGLMRDDFFIDFIDIEWSLRAKNFGYSVFMSPNVTMEHNIGDKRIKLFNRLISLHSDFRKYYIYRNGLYMVKLPYVPFWYKVRLLVLNSIRSLLGIFLSEEKSKTLKVTMGGWKDGFFNKVGCKLPNMDE